jgi:hypothetical protein
MKLIEFLHATSEAKRVSSKKEKRKLDATVGGNEGERDREDDEPRQPPISRDQEGSVSWDWTDPIHSSGTTNAVLSGTP